MWAPSTPLTSAGPVAPTWVWVLVREEAGPGQPLVIFKDSAGTPSVPHLPARPAAPQLDTNQVTRERLSHSELVPFPPALGRSEALLTSRWAQGRGE